MNMRQPRKRYDKAIQKCTITLFSDQVIWLDRIALNTRIKTKKYADRSSMVRSIIDSAREQAKTRKTD